MSDGSQRPHGLLRHLRGLTLTLPLPITLTLTLTYGTCEAAARTAAAGDSIWLFCESSVDGHGAVYFWAYIYYLSKVTLTLTLTLTLIGHGAVYFRAYIYYLSKYYELLDTGVQYLRGP